MQTDARRFLSKVIMLAIVFYAISFFGSVLFEQLIDWRASRDPRDRLLWDQHTDEAELVLLGDSVFISSFVNSVDDSLVKLLEVKTGKRVFNGALNGAASVDFLNAARLIQRNGTKDAVVVVDILPTRFLERRHPAPVLGNYHAEFSSLLGEEIVARTLAVLKKPLPILDLDILLDAAARPQWYGDGDNRDRVWNVGDFARKRFANFEAEHLLESDAPPSFQWVEELDGILKKHSNRLVAFITPFNRMLIRQYATSEAAEKYEAYFTEANRDLLSYLHEKNIPYIDGFSQFDSDSFVDLTHLNARGERHIADLIADYLRKDQNADSPSTP